MGSEFMSSKLDIWARGHPLLKGVCWKFPVTLELSLFFFFFFCIQMTNFFPLQCFSNVSYGSLILPDSLGRKILWLKNSPLYNRAHFLWIPYVHWHIFSSKETLLSKIGKIFWEPLWAMMSSYLQWLLSFSRWYGGKRPSLTSKSLGSNSSTVLVLPWAHDFSSPNFRFMFINSNGDNDASL